MAIGEGLASLAAANYMRCTRHSPPRLIHVIDHLHQ
jgi:myosin-crossreactive antigen